MYQPRAELWVDVCSVIPPQHAVTSEETGAREVSLEVTQPVSVKGGSVSGALPILRYLLPPSSWTLPNPSQ